MPFRGMLREPHIVRFSANTSLSTLSKPQSKERKPGTKGALSLFRLVPDLTGNTNYQFKYLYFNPILSSNLFVKYGDLIEE